MKEKVKVESFKDSEIIKKLVINPLKQDGIGITHIFQKIFL